MKWNTRALIPGLIAAVVVMAVATVWMTMRPGASAGSGRPDQPVEDAVVRAPPLTAPNTAVVGGPPSPKDKMELCANCGVVEAVQATKDHSRFQMSIRLADGSLREVEQAAPLVVGSRVVMQGGVARPAPVGTQG